MVNDGTSGSSTAQSRKVPKVAATFRNPKGRFEAPSKKQLALSAARALRLNRETVQQQQQLEDTEQDRRDDFSEEETSTLVSDGYDEYTLSRDEASSSSDSYTDEEGSYDSDMDSETGSSEFLSDTLSDRRSASKATYSSYSYEESDFDGEKEAPAKEKSRIIISENVITSEQEDTVTKQVENLQIIHEGDKKDVGKQIQDNLVISDTGNVDAADKNVEVDCELNRDEDDESEKLQALMTEKVIEHLSKLEPIRMSTVGENCADSNDFRVTPLDELKKEFKEDKISEYSGDKYDEIPATVEEKISDSSEHTNDEFPAKFEEKMSDPSEKLAGIISIGLDEPSCSRRMNAYGAFKTMAASDGYAVPLAWTKGVLKALAHALNDPDSTEGELHRSISALLLLSNHTENRKLMLIAPGLVTGFIKTSLNTCPEISHRSCLSLLNLAKGKQNRVPLSENDSLLEALTTLIRTSAVSECEKLAVVKTRVASVHSIALTASNILLELSKIREVAYTLARHTIVMNTFVDVSGFLPEQVDIVCQVTMANLTRVPENALPLVYHVKNFVTVLVLAASSSTAARRKYACFALQNLSCESGCRQELGYEPKLLQVLLQCSRSSDAMDEQESALTALDNLSKEPSNLVNFTNNGIVAGLLAHAKDNSKPTLLYLACDALATLAHWIKETTNAGFALLPKDAERRFIASREHVCYGVYK